MITALGIIAGFFTSWSLVPQVFKTHKTKSTDDFSSLYLVTLETGVFLWLIYGFIVKDYPIMIANVFGFIFISYIIFVKFRYKK